MKSAIVIHIIQTRGKYEYDYFYMTIWRHIMERDPPRLSEESERVSLTPPTVAPDPQPTYASNSHMKI